MSFLEQFAKFLHPVSTPATVQPIEADKILPFVFQLCANPALIADEIERYKKTQVLPPAERELAFIPIYLSIEAIILAHKPPDVKESFTKESLRALVIQQVNPAALSRAFQLLFLSEKPQLVLLFEMGVDPVIGHIVSNLGIETIRKIMPVVTEKNVLSFVTITDQGLSFEHVYPQLESSDISQINQNCERFMRTLYEVLLPKLGREKTESVFLHSFSFIKSLYGYEFAAIFLDMLPGELLEDERVALLSRQELQKKVSEAIKGEREKRELSDHLAQELQKRVQEFNEQNTKLTHAKEAMMTLLSNAKELEIALQRERDRAHAIINSMGEGMVVVDANERVSYINPVAEKLLSLDKTHGVGIQLGGILRLIYDPTKEDQTHVLSQAMNQGITTVFHLGEHFLLQTIKGNTFPVSLALTPLPGKSGAVLLFRDRTPERLVKQKIEHEVTLRTQELLEEQAKLTASINSLQRAFIMTDVKGEILLTNTALNTLLGVIRTPWTLEIVQQKLGKSIDLLAFYKECQASKKPTLISQVQFGSKFLRISINPFFLSEEHTFLGILIQLEDITDDIILQRSRDEFFSIASHELRTPLTSIRGNIALIKQFYPQLLQDKNLAGMVDDIHVSSIRLIKMVNDFLNLSRLELGKITFKKELFDMLPLITDSVKEIEPLLQEKKLSYRFEASGVRDAFVYADKERLREVLTNLLSNAVKFTDKGGVTIKVEKRKTEVVVQVADTGRGIPLKNQSLLFRKFQQASDNIITRDTGQSTGLGLYIAKLLMQGMDGTITLVSSTENNGATFQISLPIPD